MLFYLLRIETAQGHLAAQNNRISLLIFCVFFLWGLIYFYKNLPPPYNLFPNQYLHAYSFFFFTLLHSHYICIYLMDIIMWKSGYDHNFVISKT